MEQKYQKFNNILGWAVFLISAIVYLLTMERTASFWDCGEYISCSYKLEVGHPPGAPFFMMIGRIFTLFAFGDTSKVAMMINALSGLCSAGTILFLFWTITYFTKKIVLKGGAEMNDGKMFAILGSGLVGALAYTFSESFWFSAVEGEVYAMSSFFTAAVFWAVLKWEQISDEPHADRWIVLIFFLLGLAIGVHLLGILVIPLFVFVYYFKKYKVTRNGFIFAGIISLVILGFVQSIVIPGVVSLSAKFELFFVNSVGMPFNSGTIIYFILLIGTLVWALRYTIRKKKVLWNTALLCFTALLIGYSTFFILIIRSQANTPIDENNPENAISLLSYLKREQYGDWPILYGQDYNAPLYYGDDDCHPGAEPMNSVDADDPTPHYTDGDPIYVRSDEEGRYIIADDRKDQIPNYDKRFCRAFPRMWSQQGSHERAYKSWGDVKGTAITVRNPSSGEHETLIRPTFGENFAYFWKYQVVHMYLRYFMWNFSGRQNDIQGHGIEFSSRIEGNWISGIPFIDEMRLGPQDNLPESVTQSKANNKFYCFPLLLGLIGLIFQFRRDQENWFMVMLMFVLTGIAIVVYLNQYPYQPRERDYAYTASFYAFAIWIGMSVAAISEFLGKKFLNERLRAALTTVVCLLAVPTIMAKEGWDDHDRSNRYTCLDFAAAYLNSCAPNAILFTNGDNDTFPLWYVQEVEGIRTDVRVINLSLANTDWYINQLRSKMYDSDPIPLMLDQSKYAQGNRDFVPIKPRDEVKDKFMDLKEMVSFMGSDDPRTRIPWGHAPINYLPTTKFRLPVDSANFLKTLRKDLDNPATKTIAVNDTSMEGMIAAAGRQKKILPYIEWDMGKKGYIMKNDLLILDILAANNWARPVYFAVTVGPDAFVGLEKNFQIEGLAYRLVPYGAQSGQPRVSTEIMYDNLMNKVKWGGLDQGKDVWMDENNMRMALTMRMQMRTLAMSLIQEGKKEAALTVLKKELESLPEKNVPYFYDPIAYTYYLAQAFYMAGGKEDAIKISKRFFDIIQRDTDYALSVRKKESNAMQPYLDDRIEMMQQLISDAHRFEANDLANELESRFKKYESLAAPPPQQQGMPMK
ncbi:MAG: DUF2723 domain-containing protein [Bacteroidetes bacterium]|nr:MAG: DUF2723 domain-containing protein [Bacteroidota bacterium]